MKVKQLKELVKQVMKEEHEYQQLFKHMLDKTGKDINSMSDDEKKKFFNAVDTAYKAKSEGRLTGYNEAELTDKQKQIDTDEDGEIEASDLAALRDKSESINEEELNWDTVHNVFVKFLKANTKELEKRVLSKDADATKKAIESIVSGLTNAQRSLKLK